jgi:hypothetical protein
MIKLINKFKLWHLAILATAASPIALMALDPYDVIAPTGGADDSALVQSHLNTSATKTVYMLEGDWHICHTVSLPQDGHLKGASTGSSWSNLGNSALINGTKISCPSGSGGFVAKSGFIQTHDRATVDGIGIQCFNDPNHPVSGIDARNATSIVVRNSQFNQCLPGGVDRFSDGNDSHGNAHAHAQLAVIENNFFYGGGYATGCTNGGQISDEVVRHNDFIVSSVQSNCVYGLKLTDNRIEDGGFGVTVEGPGGYVSIDSNQFDRTWPPIRISSGPVYIANNQFTGYPASEGGPSPTSIEFTGNVSYITVGVNHFLFNNASAYKVDAGVSVTNSSFYTPDTDLNVWADAYTASVIGPQVIGGSSGPPPNLALPVVTPFSSVSLIGSAFAAPDFTTAKNWSYSLPHSTSPYTIPNPSSSFEGQTGIIMVAQDAIVGSDTVTWGSAFSGTIPTLSTAANIADYIPYFVQGGKVILGAKSSSSAPPPPPPPPNILAGNSGMTSGWGMERTTLTNGVGADPAGGNTASAVKEDGTANDSHNFFQTISPGVGTLTCNMYVHAGTSGTRNFEMIMWDTNWASNGWADFNQSGIKTASGGSATVNATQDAGGGWHRVSVTYNLPTAPVHYYIFFDNGQNIFAPHFSGDNKSNVWFWGPNCHAGSSP